jgi:DNA (cytosine-5)-methyltransferase 1
MVYGTGLASLLTASTHKMATKISKISGFTVVDLFAGAGGFSLAAHNCGFDVVGAIEFDELASETYRRHIVDKLKNTTKLVSRDILQVDAGEFKSDLGLAKGELDLLVGGPPCQGFSTHRIKNQGVADPRNQLLLRYFDFVKELSPKCFLVENVPGLLWPRHQLYLQKFKKLAKDAGYQIYGPTRINAKDYGVPQNRERVFILGTREDCDISQLTWPPNKTHGDTQSGLIPWKTASTVFATPPSHVLAKLEKIIGREVSQTLTFGQSLSSSKVDESAINMSHTQSLIERFSKTPINGGREDLAFRLPCHKDGYGGHKDVYGRIRLAQPGPTMTTGCFNPSKGRFLHPWLDHGMSVRHAARFQTFPDDFVFSGGITNQGKQVGNAVPVVLAQAIINEVKLMLQHAVVPNRAIA